jgi:dUTP pyrophosphatase
MDLKIKNLSGFKLPQYKTKGAVGFDLQAVVKEGKKVLKSKGTTVVDTGLYFAVPKGYELQIRARSGLAFKNGIGLVNGIGTIDQDYRGEVKVCLYNLSEDDFVIEHGMRIAQAVLSPVEIAKLKEVSDLDETDRGSGGFGHTGV